jgi:hypothetical protein
MMQKAILTVYDKGVLIDKRDKPLNVYTHSLQNTNDPENAEKSELNAFAADNPEKKFEKATFGGLNSYKQWRQYLEKNVTIPERFLSVLKRDNYEVAYSFCVNKEGRTEDIFVIKSCEWSADAEVIAGIRKSPRWEPATENGHKVNYYQNQSITFQIFYPSNDSVETPVDDTPDSEKIFIKAIQIEAMFPGRTEAWNQYLDRHLNCYVAVENGAPVGYYTVTVSFAVDKEGNVYEVKALNDPGYGMAEEAVRVFKKSPPWIPAVYKGRNVFYRQKQTLTFSVFEK